MPRPRRKLSAATVDAAAPTDTELYGEWQTEPYVPPTAKDGIVPRGPYVQILCSFAAQRCAWVEPFLQLIAHAPPCRYGNVDLFHPSMLPIGTVRCPNPIGRSM